MSVFVRGGWHTLLPLSPRRNSAGGLTSRLAFVVTSRGLGVRRLHNELVPTFPSEMEPHIATTADLARLPSMRSAELRKLSQAAAAEGADPALWSAIASRCQDTADEIHHWDAVHVLQSFTSARVDNRPLFLRFAEVLSGKTSKFAPKHVLDLFAVYEAYELRPRGLYVELFHSIIRLSRSMYAEELSLTVQALARYHIGNPTVIAHLVRTLRLQLVDFRLRYLCGVAGALGSLHACPPKLLDGLDKQARFEVQTVAVQELLDNLHAFPLLEFSWKPYEQMCLSEFLQRLNTFETADDIDELAEPFEVMLFLKARGLLQPQFLEALSQWSLRGVHRPNVRSERRPSARQLIMLHDECRELDLENALALQDAIQYYVESAGGLWAEARPQPLRYRKKRNYLRTPDPLEGIINSTLTLGKTHSPQQSVTLDLPGLPTSNIDSWKDTLLEEQMTTDVSPPRRIKPSMPAPGLGPDETTVACWVTSRRGPRNPRHRRDPGMKRMNRKNAPRAPLWIQGGWGMRPKYQPGVATPKYPWKGVPLGRRGGGWILRR